MVQFPNGFVQLEKYPGYYWNVESQHLFSCKSGVLKKMKRYGYFNGYTKQGYLCREAGYQISVFGKRVYVNECNLRNLVNKLTIQIFPVASIPIPTNAQRSLDLDQSRRELE